jgi:hypothetical protein
MLAMAGRHDHLHGLATPIHETSGLDDKHTMLGRKKGRDLSRPPIYWSNKSSHSSPGDPFEKKMPLDGKFAY